MDTKSAVALVLWFNIIRNAQGTCPQPPNFPPSISLTVTNYHNWDGERVVNNLWMAIPSTPNDVVTLANWAHQNNFKLRASGNQHSWSPITITSGTSDCTNVMLVNTSNHLTSVSLMSPLTSSINYAKVQPGILMDDFLLYLEQNGYGFYNAPMIGDLTLGGALSINAHGTSVKAVNETLPPGHLYGSLSNKVINLTAVVWDSTANQYKLKSFHRSDPESSAFLVHLGRSFITEVTIMVGKNYNMRCISYTNISVATLFANSTTGQTVANFLNSVGRLEIVWFAFTDTPWVLARSITPKKPLLSLQVSKPYPYIFLDAMPAQLNRIVQNMTNGAGSLAPTFGNSALLYVKAGLLTTGDIWGPSKNIMTWMKPSFFQIAAIAYVVQTSRSNIQNVVSKLHSFFQTLVTAYANAGKYPSNFVIYYRFTGLDSSINSSWSIPGISAVRPLKPTFDTAFWFNVLPFPNSPYQSEFAADIESFMFETFNDDNAMAMVEWSKSWAYTAANGAHTNTTVLNTLIPNALKDSWNATVDTLNKYDPNHIFSNSFLDSLLVDH